MLKSFNCWSTFDPSNESIVSADETSLYADYMRQIRARTTVSDNRVTVAHSTNDSRDDSALERKK